MTFHAHCTPIPRATGRMPVYKHKLTLVKIHVAQSNIPVHNRTMTQTNAETWRRKEQEWDTGPRNKRGLPPVIWWKKGDFDIGEANGVYTTFVTDAAGSRRAWGELTTIGKLGREIHEFHERLFQAMRHGT